MEKGRVGKDGMRVGRRRCSDGRNGVGTVAYWVVGRARALSARLPLAPCREALQGGPAGAGRGLAFREGAARPRPPLFGLLVLELCPHHLIYLVLMIQHCFLYFYFLLLDPSL